MVSSLYAPSRRRAAALWREFQRPLQREIMLAAAALHTNPTDPGDASSHTLTPQPETSTHSFRRESKS